MDRYSCCQYASIRAHAGTREILARHVYAGFPEPDVTFFLAVAPEVAYARIDARGTDHEDLAHLAAADAAYRSLPEWAHLVVIDADADPASVQAALRASLTAQFGQALPKLANTGHFGPGAEISDRSTEDPSPTGPVPAHCPGTTHGPREQPNGGLNRIDA
jgi:dTMP kinase